MHLASWPLSSISFLHLAPSLFSCPQLLSSCIMSAVSDHLLYHVCSL
ncbi:unnamed protein product [Staurois parvus]|uniref:Uncharacterized protein n=1 Tax=Staurois parvus TaxID=386267 RepID=A0ABN9DCB1_9NEOB|nr:unnamed protein product [Staurois parvus]